MRLSLLAVAILCPALAAGQTVDSVKHAQVPRQYTVLIDSITVYKTERPTPPPPDSTPTPSLSKGIWFGPYAAPDDNFFSAEFLSGTSAGSLISEISRARARHKHLVIPVAGGSHQQYKVGGKFDDSTWARTVDAYGTPAIKAAIAAAVADGTIIGASVMDEPQQEDKPGNDNKSWGPHGWMTKARVDRLCAYVKKTHPTLPTGVVHDQGVFEPTVNYAKCDFIATQYRLSKASVTAFRDEAMTFCKRSKIACIMMFNSLHGGAPSKTCEKYGDDNPAGTLCPPTPAQVFDWAITLGSVGCALITWRYEAALFTQPDYAKQFKRAVDSLAQLPRRPCVRTG